MMPTFQRSRQPERPAWSQEQLLRERAVLLGYSVAASTNLTYDSALASYTEFCHKHNFPLEPTVDTLSFSRESPKNYPPSSPAFKMFEELLS